MIGDAKRLLTGAMRLTRPNVQATSGADAIVATVVPIIGPAIERLQLGSRSSGSLAASREPAIRAATPITLN